MRKTVEISRETITIDEFLSRKGEIYLPSKTVLKINGRNVDYVYRHLPTGRLSAILLTFKGEIELKGSDLITIIRKERK